MKKLLSIFLIVFLVLTAIPVSAASPSSKMALTIVFNTSNIDKTVTAKIEKLGLTIISEHPELGALQVEGSPSLIPIIQNIKGIKAVSPSLKMKLSNTKMTPYDKSKHLPKDMNTFFEPAPEPGPTDEVFPILHHILQWDIKRVTNDGNSYLFEKGNHDVVVGIIDTGVDIGHPDLQKNLLGGRNYVPEHYGGDETETGNPEDYQDRNGHGSHVAGAIAGKGLILGVAPEVGYKAYRVLGKNGDGTTDTVVKAIVGATNDKVDVISMSLGGYNVLGQTFWTDPATGKKYNLGNEVADFLLYKRAIKYASDHGVTIVAAAGNENLNISNRHEITKYLNAEYAEQGLSFIGAGVELPGGIPGVITVAATGPEDLRASYSNYGPGIIDITAPGGDYERYPDGEWFEDMNFGAYINNDYAYMAGTSMAAPKVSAIAALYISHYGKMSPSKVEAMIYESADDLGRRGNDKVFYGKGMAVAPQHPVELPDYIEWQEHYGGFEFDTPSKVHQTKDGGYLIVGGTNSFSKAGGYDYDMYVLKSDENGNVEWRTTIGGMNNDYGFDFIEAKDGSYIVVGQTQSLGNGEDMFPDIVVAKIDSNGVNVWEKYIGESEISEVPKFILQTEDNGIMIAGEKQGNIYLYKMDENGNRQWEKQHDYQINAALTSIVETSDNGFIMGVDSNPRIKSPSDFQILKVSSTGDKEWEKIYGNEEKEEVITGIQETPDGYLLVGNSGVKISESRFLLPSYTFINDIYFAKIDNTGTIQWEKTMGEKNIDEKISSMIATSDGNFVLIGSETIDGFSDISLTKVNSNGDKIWDKRIGGEENDEGMMVEQTRDGGYILVGSSYSYSYGFGTDDMFLVKISNLVDQ